MTDDQLGRGYQTEDLSSAVLWPAWEEHPEEGGNWFASPKAFGERSEGGGGRHEIL